MFRNSRTSKRVLYGILSRFLSKVNIAGRESIYNTIIIRVRLSRFASLIIKTDNILYSSIFQPTILILNQAKIVCNVKEKSLLYFQMSNKHGKGLEDVSIINRIALANSN